MWVLKRARAGADSETVHERAATSPQLGLRVESLAVDLPQPEPPAALPSGRDQLA